MSQTTIISFFKYQGIKNKWHALGRMGRSPLTNIPVQGLTFWRPLGSGSGNGFSIWPDWSTFGLLTVFKSEDLAELFLKTKTIKEYEATSKSYSHVMMHNIKAQGQWKQKKPFISGANYDENKPIAVITRATIKPKMALQFWKNVPSVSKSMEGHQGLIYSKGIGEWPIFMQATFSLWENGKDMINYAYQNKKHAAMVKKTRDLGWYSEELFSRFHLYKIKGDLIKF